MRQLFEDRSAAELVAAEALLNLAGLRCEPNIWSNFFNNLPQHRQAKTTIVTSTPYPKPPKKRVYIAPIEEQQTEVLPINYSIQECDNLSPVSNGYAVSVAAMKPTTELTPSIPIRRNSGRVIKRTRRFISQSDEETDLQNDVQKSATPGKHGSKMDKNTMKNSEDHTDVIHPAKKIKIEPVCEVNEPKVNDKNCSDSKNKSKSSAKLKHDLFNANIMTSIQSDAIRHSRLFEAAYELQNRTKPDAIVEFQFRAVENLIAYKAEIDAKRNQFSSNRSSKAMKLMRKFRGLKNRQQVCNEFASKFRSTESADWKPFTEDTSRSRDISDYRVLQMTRQPIIKCCIDQFLTQSRGKEKARSTLMEIYRILPNRPEVRHDFIIGHLPKLVAAYKQAIKKSKRLRVKSETVDIDAALPKHF